MKGEPAWRRYLRFWGPDPNSDIDHEFQFHLQTKTDDLIASGLPPDDARREALRQFGPVSAVRKECSAIGRGRVVKASRKEYFAGWFRDGAYAFRMLRKTKASSGAAILILAVGIGANTAVFTFFDRLLYRPLPVPNPSQLVLISNSFSYDAYLHLRDHAQTFSGLAAETRVAPRERRLHEKIERPAIAHSVSGNFFNVLGVSAYLGRVFAPSDDVRSGHVAVASYRFWSRRFNRASDVLGRTVYLEGVPFTIVGVTPSRFFGTANGSDPDVYVPMGVLPDVFSFNPLTQCCLTTMFGRLRQDASPQMAQTNLQALWDPFPRKSHMPAHIEVEDGSRGYAGTSGEKRSSLLLLAAIVAILLLIGCANVACLQIARGTTRQQEIAIRMSLGATKARIVRQSLMESLVLATIGGAAALLVAFWAGRLLLIAFQWKDRAIDLSPDWRVLTFAFGVSLATGLLFGLAPAMQWLRGARVAFSHNRTVAGFTTGKALIVIEVALSLVMVAGSAVFIRSFQNLRSTPMGFVADGVSVIRLISTDQDSNYKLFGPAREAIRLVDSLQSTPGVESAAVSDEVTFNSGSIGNQVARLDNPGEPALSAIFLRVDQNYFETLHMPLLSGRGFASSDDGGKSNVAILAEATARHLFPNANPLGKTIRVGVRYPYDLQIIGVVKDIKYQNVREPAPDLLYQPVKQLTAKGTGAGSGMMNLHVRSRLTPANIAAIVRDRIRQEHLAVTVEAATTLEDEIGATLLNDRIRMQASSLFGALALLLITAGIYGLMAHSAVRRTREIGIRMAVGSSPGQIAQLMLKESTRLVALGVVLGIPGALAVMKAVSGLVFGLPPVDGVSLAAAALILSATGIAASVGPAWRAARLDPVNALRLE